MVVAVVRADSKRATSSDPKRPISPTDPLSNEEFKRVLSLNSEEDGLNLEESFAANDYDDDDEEEEIIFNCDFTTKLERLVAMRHRHYERQNILHKHKKQKEEKHNQIQLLKQQDQELQLAKQLKEEARQRELKLRRHEMELDMDEIEAEFSPRAIMIARQRVSSGGGSATGSSLGDGSTSFTNAVVSPMAMRKQQPHSDPNNNNNKPTTLQMVAERKRSHKASASDPDLYAMSMMSSSSGTRNGSGGNSKGGNFDIAAVMESELADLDDNAAASSNDNLKPPVASDGAIANNNKNKHMEMTTDPFSPPPRSHSGTFANNTAANSPLPRSHSIGGARSSSQL
jgi:hypothetical protein